MRETQQREAIRHVLLSSGRPLSIDEIFTLAKNEVGSLGIATVYRNLKSLQSGGFIIQVDLPGESPRWEVLPEGHHHHFLCRTCDKLYEIQVCSENLLHMLRMLPEGYILEDHDILLRGQCVVCAKGKTSKTEETRKNKKPRQ